MRTYLLAFGAFVFVQVISEQIHYKGTLTVDATNASGHYSNSVLLSIRSCDEGSKFSALDKNRKRRALFVIAIKA